MDLELITTLASLIGAPAAAAGLVGWYMLRRADKKDEKFVEKEQMIFNHYEELLAKQTLRYDKKIERDVNTVKELLMQRIDFLQKTVDECETRHAKRDEREESLLAIIERLGD